MRHLKTFNEKFTEVFVVDTKSKKVQPSSRSSYTYWYGDKKGQVDMEISVNSESNQQEYAEKIYDALKIKNLASVVKKVYVDFKEL